MLMDPANLSLKAFNYLGRSLRLRSAERDLRQLPDFLLRDIGMDRSEISSAVRRGRG